MHSDLVELIAGRGNNTDTHDQNKRYVKYPIPIYMVLYSIIELLWCEIENKVAVENKVEAEIHQYTPPRKKMIDPRPILSH